MGRLKHGTADYFLMAAAMVWWKDSMEIVSIPPKTIAIYDLNRDSEINL